jgi:hypothetical protein
VPEILGGAGLTDSPVSADAADFNADGDLELVCANQDGDSLAFFERDANGAFVLERSLDVVIEAASPTAFAIVDLDRDGLLDIVAPNGIDEKRGAKLAGFLQDAPGFFEANIDLDLAFDGLETDGFRAVRGADLDANGLVDVLTGDQSLIVFYQREPGSFSVDEVKNVDCNDIAVGDLSGDGILDVAAVAGAVEDEVTIVFNDGGFPAGLARRQVFGTPTEASSVGIADLDLDGSGDFFCATFEGHTVAVFLQVGAGRFESKEVGIFPQVQSPLSAVAGDVDGDGDPDIVVANRDPNNVLVFWGGHE